MADAHTNRTRTPLSGWAVIAGPVALGSLLLLVAGVLLVTAGCGGGAAPSSLAVTEEEDGDTLTAAVGDVVTVRLEENPSTGYAWRATASDGLTLTDDRFIAPSVSPGLVGAGGTRVLAYEVASGGTQRIEAVYERPWESGTTEPAATFSVTIEVR